MLAACGSHRSSRTEMPQVSVLSTIRVGMSAEMKVMQQAWLQAARHLPRGIRLMMLASPSEPRRVGPGVVLDGRSTVEVIAGQTRFFPGHDVFDPQRRTRRQPADAGRAHERVERTGRPLIRSRVLGTFRKGLAALLQ